MNILSSQKVEMMAKRLYQYLQSTKTNSKRERSGGLNKYKKNLFRDEF